VSQEGNVTNPLLKLGVTKHWHQFLRGLARLWFRLVGGDICRRWGTHISGTPPEVNLNQLTGGGHKVWVHNLCSSKIGGVGIGRHFCITKERIFGGGKGGRICRRMWLHAVCYSEKFERGKFPLIVSQQETRKATEEVFQQKPTILCNIVRRKVLVGMSPVL